MPSHSASDTVDDAPADSAVSVVGTGVWLGARPDAISNAICWRLPALYVRFVQVATSHMLRVEGCVDATGPCVRQGISS